MDRISWKSTFGLTLAAMVWLMAAPASAGITYNVTNYAEGQDGWSVNGTITVSGLGTFTNASAITAWDVTLSKLGTGSYQFTNTLAGHDGKSLAGTLTASTGTLNVSNSYLFFYEPGNANYINWDPSNAYLANFNNSLRFYVNSFSPSNNGEWTVGTATPSAVPEIDPAGMGSVLALVTGALGLLERRRLKTA